MEVRIDEQQIDSNTITESFSINGVMNGVYTLETQTRSQNLLLMEVGMGVYSRDLNKIIESFTNGGTNR